MRENLGQMIMTGISGTSLTKDEADFIQKKNIGGVLLFSHNFESPAQLAELINEIQKQRDEYPLFIAVDQEGGRVQRFKEPFTKIPCPKELATLGSPKTVFHITKILAQELYSCGVNVNFAPVCDILTNTKNTVIGDRSFSNDPEEVTRFISSVIRGLKTNHVMSCAKHFPGHGSTTKDSHYDLPIVKTSIESLREVEFKPFVKAVKSKVDFLMMAHLIVDEINQDLPCSLAPDAYKIVRDELRFQKIIITDDMQMKAISDHYGLEDAGLRALVAGADMIEYRDFSCALKAMESIEKAYKTKEIEKNKVDKKLERINSVKKENLGSYRPIYIPDLQKVFSDKSSQVFMQEVYTKIEQLKY